MLTEVGEGGDPISLEDEDTMKRMWAWEGFGMNDGRTARQFEVL